MSKLYHVYYHSLKNLKSIMNDNIVRIINPNKYYLVLTSINETKVRCEIRYTFAHGCTDEITIMLPRNTRLFVEVTGGEMIIYANVIRDKKQIRKIIETTLDRMFPDMREDYTPLCECFRIFLSKNDIKNFHIAEATQSDLLDTWCD